MIESDEIHAIALAGGVPLTYVEKDYVMGWVLWALFKESEFSDRLVLKGGNCLRKAYFPDTRFSDDLDFTARSMPSEQEFYSELLRLCDLVGAVARIPSSLN